MGILFLYQKVCMLGINRHEKHKLLQAIVKTFQVRLVGQKVNRIDGFLESRVRWKQKIPRKTNENFT